MKARTAHTFLVVLAEVCLVLVTLALLDHTMPGRWDAVVGAVDEAQSCGVRVMNFGALAIVEYEGRQVKKYFHYPEDALRQDPVKIQAGEGVELVISRSGQNGVRVVATFNRFRILKRKLLERLA